MNYYKRHIGDYAAATRHLSILEHGAYNLMLDTYYTTEQPLPVALKDVCRKVGARSKDEVSAVETLLTEFFELTDAGWVQSRCETEIAAYQQKAEINRATGKKGGRPKKQTTTVISDNPEITQTVSEIETHGTLTTNHEPLTTNHSVTSVTVGKPTLTPDEIIFTYGLPLLTNAGTAEKQARSFLGGLRKAHGDDALVNTLRECIRAKPLQPLEWLAKAMLPDATGSPAETRYQRSKREQMERDFPNLTNKPEFSNVAALELD